MGISGMRIESPFVAPMSKDYPVPPVPLKASGALMKTALPSSDSPSCADHWQSSPRTIGAYRLCELRHVLRLWLPCQSPFEFCRDDAAAGRKDRPVRIRARSYVREISVDANGKVNGVVYFDPQKREIRQRAKAVILCANGTESARLLLLSKSARFPNGLANTNDVVGRYLMLGNTVSASGLFEHDLNDYKGVVTGAAIVDFVPSDPKRGFYGGGRMTARGFDTPINYALRGLQPGAPRWGCLQKQALRDEANHKMTITSFVTQLPLATNRGPRPRGEGRVGTPRHAHHLAESW